MTRQILISILGFIFVSGAFAQETADKKSSEVPPISEPVVCAEDAKPAMLLVEGVNSDREKFGRYSQALRQSKIYEQLEGYYITVGDPVELLEGEWPEERFKVIARFPCKERVHQFWYSNTYEQLKELREGAGEVRAMVYEEFEMPERITWSK